MLDIQNHICKSLEEIDGKGKFITDRWEREEGGGGISRVIENGRIFEKGGVNFSRVYGTLTDKARMSLKTEHRNFFATGVSIVIHPKNPLNPIIHANFRYFQMDNEISWFGGGIDLTPIYIEEDNARIFHLALKEICDKYNPAFYADFKDQADNYFYLPHRNETRGVGGIFFDQLNPNEFNFLPNFIKDLGHSFPEIYRKQLANDITQLNTIDPEEKKWQLVRRGRYVEFNLIYDRGTKFGLETGGRTESILMSLPPTADWIYNYSPEKNSREQETMDLLKKGIDWVNYSC